MERDTFFADIILPLAMPRVLTYRVPRVYSAFLKVGQRVIVPIGKQKLYTGIVQSIHNNVPVGYEARYIEEILDEFAIVNEYQLRLWSWMAEYYACTIGEVMSAALPGGLKLSSETKFVLPDKDVAFENLTEKESIIVESLRNNDSLTTDDLSKILEIKNVRPVLKSLLDKRIIGAEEEIREKFKPRTADMVSLGPLAQNEKQLGEIFSALEKRKAQKQIDILMMLLQMTNYDQGQFGEVDRLKLQNATKSTAANIQTLVQKGWATIRTIEIGRLPSHLLASEAAKTLSEAQQKALEEINLSFETNDVTLLEGVTSSGKTEVYIHLIEQTLAEGKQALFLLPEIALTTQIIHRLRKHFGNRVGIYHSGYSDNERTEVWNKVLAAVPGECDLILGARSSVFLPFNRLGLVIVDEEHETSFKQHDPAPRYHARDTAIVLASFFKSKVLLGSATPAIETYWNAKQNRFGLVQITERFGGVSMPEIVVTDLRKETKAKTMNGNFSSELLEGMRLALENGEQIILFQNRRGYSPVWQCHTCGWTPQCTRCDVSLTYHKNVGQLKCHYCGYSHTPPSTCSACGSHELKMLGFGTEKIEEDIQAIFPEANIQRMDLETTRNKNSYQKIIQDFETGKTNILVGTQMVTKGLDFDNVSVVGIMNADKMMKFPDYRSIERSYQLMMQVAGRAGRRGKQGRVFIQTYNPTHWLFDLVRKGDYQSLYNHEENERHHFGYPPFIRMMKVTIKHKDDHVAALAAERAKKLLTDIAGKHVLGPEKPYIPKINNYYLWQFMIKQLRNKNLAEEKKAIRKALWELTAEPEFKSVRVSIDVDPL
ncbi:MAG: primosomal protein [Bacteroidota bacterium]|jgi:primosomal protein N' (replication factor Y)